MVALVSRTGRHLQRYNKGCRQIVGCIPYRYKVNPESGLEEEEAEVLVVTSQKGKGMLFPKGGWESDESLEEAASRETLEEAGVLGIVLGGLGKWFFKSKTHDSDYEGYLFPLLVEEQLDFWPEMNVRQRKWMSVKEAREVCLHWWMKEALDILVLRLESSPSQPPQKLQEGEGEGEGEV
ncbi:NUDIX hydrolase domain, partial [Dillenia turbinata]